eukprot:g4039.t1
MQSLSTAAVVYLVSGLCQVSHVAGDADLCDVHCLANDFAGPDQGGGRNWIFEFTAPKDSPFDPSTFGDICGHRRPGRGPFVPELPMPEVVVLSVEVTLHPDLTAVVRDVQRKSPDVGRILDLLTSAPALSTDASSIEDKVRDLVASSFQWSPVVDEGIELDIGNLHLFAYSALARPVPPPASQCLMTQVGWYSKIVNAPSQKKDAFGCWRGYQNEDSYSAGSPKKSPEKRSGRASFLFLEREGARLDRPAISPGSGLRLKKRAPVSPSFFEQSAGASSSTSIRSASAASDEMSECPSTHSSRVPEDPDRIVLPHEHQACVDYVNSHDLGNSAPGWLRDEFDWRDSKNGLGHWRIVPEAGDQGIVCGGCYAYAFAKSMTARLRVQMVRKLREQGVSEEGITGELTRAPKFTQWYGIGCSEMNQGCNGGTALLLGQWSHIYGLAPETPGCIPRGGWQEAAAGDGGGTCQRIPKECPRGELVYRTKNARFLGLEGYALDASEHIIRRELYEKGPFPAVVMVENKWFHYQSGIIGKKWCQSKWCNIPITDPAVSSDEAARDECEVDYELSSHVVLFVGWGVEKTSKADVKFWSLQNSWGESWGEEDHYAPRQGEGARRRGFFRIKRGENIAGVESYMDTADLEELTVEEAHNNIHWLQHGDD